ncbi:MAG: hypothetical protein KJ697_00440 [Nanoarchaeota archaeon]|nr:hypothetical protein [Nanoarchaeota archaeon]
MKGISAVIAVVLILMITVALSAMAYVWFTGVFEDISGSAGEAAGAAAAQIGSGFSIVSAYDNNLVADEAYVKVTNTGTTTLKKEYFNILIGTVTIPVTPGIPAEITSTQTGDLISGETITHTITNATTSSGYIGEWCGKQVTVIYGDLEQVTTMACQ